MTSISKYDGTVGKGKLFEVQIRHLPLRSTCSHVPRRSENDQTSSYGTRRSRDHSKLPEVHGTLKLTKWPENQGDGDDENAEIEVETEEGVEEIGEVLGGNEKQHTSDQELGYYKADGDGLTSPVSECSVCHFGVRAAAVGTVLGPAILKD